MKALQEMDSQAELHLQRLRAEGIVGAEVKFRLLKPDYTRFLLKDRLNKLDSAGRGTWWPVVLTFCIVFKALSGGWLCRLEEHNKETNIY